MRKITPNLGPNLGFGSAKSALYTYYLRINRVLITRRLPHNYFVFAAGRCIKTLRAVEYSDPKESIGANAMRSLGTRGFGLMAAVFLAAATEGNAQLDMLQDRSRRHPYFWASFIPIGAWGPLALSDASVDKNFQ
jgi:hypothetical protein